MGVYDVDQVATKGLPIAPAPVMLAPLIDWFYSMPTLSPHVAFLAFALWLLSNWAGAHGHYCFDGQEPPISVHMHLDGHEVHDHHPEEVHQDADIELGKSVLAKLSKIDLGLVLLAALALVLPAFIDRFIPPLPSIGDLYYARRRFLSECLILLGASDCALIKPLCPKGTFDRIYHEQIFVCAAFAGQRFGMPGAGRGH
jgi:hypothetical protein